MPRLAFALPLLLSSTAVAQTATWPQFLGTDGTARAEGASTLSFDREHDLSYRVEVPRGKSSPCIQGDRIFLTGRTDDALVMFALDRTTGKELWRHGVPLPEKLEFMHPDAGVVMPTACTNGERVFFYVPSYGLAVYTVAGEPVWKKELPEPNTMFGIGSSPMLFEDMVILLRDGCPDAKLYAFLEETGDEVWSIPRIRFGDAHATPYIWNNRERTELVIASTGTVISYDPYEADELWRVDGLTPLVCTTPTADVDRLYFAGWSTPAAAGPDRLLAGMEEEVTLTEEERNDPAKLFARFDGDGDGKISLAEMPAGRGRTSFSVLDQDRDGGIALAEWMPLMQMPQTGKNLLVAIRAGGKGNVTDTHVAWSERRGIPYVASPLLHDGRVWIVKAGGILSSFEAESGKPLIRRKRLGDGSEYYATPIAVDGHIVVCATAGTVYVLEAADDLKIVREIDFDERIFATPAVAGGTVYLRTDHALYAFGREG